MQHHLRVYPNHQAAVAALFEFSKRYQAGARISQTEMKVTSPDGQEIFRFGWAASTLDCLKFKGYSLASMQVNPACIPAVHRELQRQYSDVIIP